MAERGGNLANNRFGFRRFLIRRSQVRTAAKRQTALCQFDPVNFAGWHSDLGGRMNNVIRRGRFFIGKSYLGHWGGAYVIMAMYKTKGVF